MRVDFWATKDDLVSSLSTLEAAVGACVYIELGQNKTGIFKTYTSAMHIPDLGVSSELSAVAAPAFELCRASEKWRPVSSRVSHDSPVFTSTYPHALSSLYLRGGYHFSSDRRLLLPGVLAHSDSMESQDFFRLAKRIFLKGYHKQKSVYISPRAMDGYTKKEFVLLSTSVLEKPDQHLKISC
jgi:hypothetical protein